jgi:HlyD family secretion protein
VLRQLKAQPRPETLAVAKAQVESAEASHRLAREQFEKQKRSEELKPGSVSREALDTARNNAEVAAANAALATRQFELTKAGAWSYDVANQERQYKALSQAAEASSSLLDKYVLKAPVDGMVLAVNTAVGSYVSSQGTYDAYTQGYRPIVVMGTSPATLAVRCFVDEILVHRLPPPEKIRAEMAVRGTEIRIPLQFVRMQPYVSPKIELSDQRQERVDVRVLPVVFRFTAKPEFRIYPGQVVDVYISQQK